MVIHLLFACVPYWQPMYDYYYGHNLVAGVQHWELSTHFYLKPPHSLPIATPPPVVENSAAKDL